MRKPFVLAVAAAVAATLFTASPAQAITYGELDDGKHPYVGALLWDHDVTNPGIEGACSGTLVSSTVFLTAAHCDPDFDRTEDPVVVSFDEDVHPVTSRTRLHAGRFIGHPQFTTDIRSYDVAVVVLDQPISGITPAQLPPAGYLDQNVTDEYTVVGYGVTHLQLYDGQRRSAVSGFIEVQPTMLHLSQNPLKGEGGTCVRDSGGPAFPGDGKKEKNIVVAITHGGDLLCTYDGEYFRTDTPIPRAFLSQFVALP
ncbi:MAG TPA: trypsin-like serine protease [Cryptosporangiaceae bacterium]|nr:trypsin-like serine protease [Cryptosporangiaceae bacterium]